MAGLGYQKGNAFFLGVVEQFPVHWEFLGYRFKAAGEIGVLEIGSHRKGNAAKKHIDIGGGVLCKVQDVSARFRNTAGNGGDESGLVGTGDGNCLLVHGLESIPKCRFLQYEQKKTSRKEEENGWSLRCYI